MSKIHEAPPIDLIKSYIENTDVIIDAMLGTGVRGELREPIKSIVDLINKSGKIVVAIDTPHRS